MYSDNNGYHNSNCSNWRFHRFPNFSIGFLHGDDDFVQSHVERLGDVTFQSDVDNLIDMQNRLICVDGLEIRVDHPCDLSVSETTHVCLWTLFINGNPKFEISVDECLEAACYLRIKNLEVAPIMVFWRLQFGNKLRGRNLADPNHCFKRTTCTVPPEIHESDQEFSQIWPLKSVNFMFLGISISHHPFNLLVKNNSTFKHVVKGPPKQNVLKELVGLIGKLSAPPFQSKTSGWFPSMRDTVSAQSHAKLLATNL